MICREQCQRYPRCKPGAAREQPVRLTVYLEYSAWDFFPRIEISPFWLRVNRHRKKPTGGWGRHRIIGGRPIGHGKRTSGREASTTGDHREVTAAGATPKWGEYCQHQLISLFDWRHRPGTSRCSSCTAAGLQTVDGLALCFPDEGIL